MALNRMSEWSNSGIEKMIELFKERPCLWKADHEDYLNKIVRNKAIQQIVKELKKNIPNVDVDSVKWKWQSMRGSFNKQQKRMEASKQSGAKEIRVPTLWYYELLSFLSDQEDHRVRNGSLTLSGHKRPGNPEKSSHSSDSQRQLSDADGSETEETNGHIRNDAGIQQSCIDLCQPSPKRIKHSRPKAPAVKEFLKTCMSVLTAPDDEWSTTGNYVALKLKQMSEPQRILAESIIQQTLSKGLRNQLTETTELVNVYSYATNSSSKS